MQGHARSGVSRIPRPVKIPSGVPYLGHHLRPYQPGTKRSFGTAPTATATEWTVDHNGGAGSQGNSAYSPSVTMRTSPTAATVPPHRGCVASPAGLRSGCVGLPTPVSALRRDRADYGCRRIHAQAGGRVSRIGRCVRAAVNPVSTAATTWWCHSAMRHMLTGYGPTARQRRFIRRGVIQGARRAPSAGQMKERAVTINQLHDTDDHQM